MDDRWKNASEPHERLRWARIQWQEAKGIKPDAGAAAESLGVKPHTYRAYERPPGSSKHTRLDDQRAIQFARKFGVNWEWLLLGTGSPEGGAHSPAQERVVSAMSNASPEEQDRIAAAVEVLLRTGTTG